MLVATSIMQTLFRYQILIVQAIILIIKNNISHSIVAHRSIIQSKYNFAN